MTTVFSWLRRLTAVLADAGAVALVVLMSATVIDIVARQLGLFSIRGVIELSTTALILIGFLALPKAFQDRGHIMIELLNAVLPPRLRARLDRFWLLVAAAVLATSSVFMWRATARVYMSNEISLDLELPMVWLWVPASSGLTISVIVCLALALRNDGNRKERK